MYNIPKQLEDLADEIIKKVDANPLALACVATGFDHQSFQDERVWQKVVEDFSDSLDSEDIIMIHNSQYRSSFWVAIHQSVERLTKEEKKLFIIVSLCRGPSVPEEVVEYFYKLLKGKRFSEFFLKAKRELENRQLIQTRESSCSIHSLLQDFVVQNLQTDQSAIESQLEELCKSDGKKGILESDREVDPDILRAIISLYFSQNTTFTTDRTTDTSSALNGSVYVLDPITRLILSNTSGLPTTTLRSHVREVFLTYMKSKSIHEEAAITLLQSSNSKCIAAITNVLVRFAEAPNHSIAVGNGVVCALLGLLGDEDLYNTVYSLSQNDLLFKAADAVYSLDQLNRKHGKAFYLNDTILFTSFNRALEQISSAMAMDDHHHLQKQAISALWRLSQILDVRNNIATPRILAELSKILNKDDHEWDQHAAASIFKNLLFAGEPVCQKVVSIPTALQGLVSALARDNNPKFQSKAAEVLEILIRKGGETIVLKISRISELLEKLVHALTKVSNPKLQEHATTIFATMAFEGNHDLCERISNVQGSFPDQTNGLERSGNVDSQFNLASQLAFSISSTCNSELQLKLAETPGLIESLVALGNDNINSPILDASAIAIRALTLIDPSRGQQIILYSAHSYLQRARGELRLGLYEESLNDLNEAWRLQPLHWTAIPSLLCNRLTVKARLDDFPGALADANSLIEISQRSVYLQERGVLKCMMDDLPGALKDLDEALDLEPNDYECLKHRGYVKFLLQDEIGAGADAKKALEIKPPYVDFKHYGRNCLGVSSVKYMGYELR